MKQHEGHDRIADASAEPRLVQGHPEKVAVVTVTGRKRLGVGRAMRALYASVGAVRAANTREGRPFDVGPLRARFPEAQTGPIEDWTWQLAVGVPDSTVLLPQLDPTVRVRIEIWVQDLLVELVHEGSEDAKPAAIARLVEFAMGAGYRPSGMREEIFLGTGPRGARTLLRSPVVPLGRRQRREGVASSLRTARARRSISSL